MNKQICSWICLWLVLGSQNTAVAERFEVEVQRLANEISAAGNRAQIATVAVADFVDLQGNTNELGRFIAEELSASIVVANKNFAVVDRANLQRIMDEHKLTTSGLVDPDNSKKLGQLAGVDAIILGTITELDQRIRVALKVIATDTAKIVASARGDLSKSPDLEKLLGRGVAGHTSERRGGSVSSTGGKIKTFIIGQHLIATLDSMRVIKQNNIEVYVTFTNRHANEVVIFTGDATRSRRGDQYLPLVVTDENGITYTCEAAAGLIIAERDEPSDYAKYCLFPGTNYFLVVAPNDTTQIRLSFVPVDRVLQTPKAVNFTAALRIISDIRSKRGYSKTLSMLNCPLD